MNQGLFNWVRAFILTLALFVIAGSSLDGSELADLSEVVRSAGVSPETSALLIVRLEDGAQWVSGGSRIDTPYPPASTAKIPHTLIALEEEYANGPDAHFEWDGQERFLEVWNQDQTLSSAFKYSVVWVYQQITHDLGYETMSAWIDQFGYGNRNIGSTEDIATYWLDGPLETSARDQVEFLSRLVRGVLPLTADTYRCGKQIMREDSAEDWMLYGKTGFSGGIGWYVGWVQRAENGVEQTYIFACNMDIASWDDLPLRKAVVRAALSELGVIEEFYADR
ncbi:Beta-lactamase LCR-1 [Chlamydiales bacterium SCGC AG-110-P3]|nr:Beta-lactamase LCR-1 [Chlamydiales bacterium SCGC AG-110-P3]